MTHLVFWAEASAGRLPSLARGKLAPLAAPAVPVLMRRRRLVAAGIRLLSQLRVSYRGSPLSVEGAPRPHGGPRAGDRLPDENVRSAGHPVRLHGLLARPGVHVLLDRDADRIDTRPLGPLVHVHRLTDAPGRGLMAVRPDGYVGLDVGSRNEQLSLMSSIKTEMNAAVRPVRGQDPLPPATETAAATPFHREPGWLAVWKDVGRKSVGQLGTPVAILGGYVPARRYGDRNFDTAAC